MYTQANTQGEVAKIQPPWLHTSHWSEMFHRFQPARSAVQWIRTLEKNTKFWKTPCFRFIPCFNSSPLLKFYMFPNLSYNTSCTMKTCNCPPPAPRPFRIKNKINNCAFYNLIWSIQAECLDIRMHCCRKWKYINYKLSDKV